jgi:uncharacterized SAM-binding protein YcdF (DUF218 family)
MNSKNNNVFQCLWRIAFFSSGVVLCIWTVAGFFMGGEDKLQGPIPMLVVLGGGITGDREELACKLFAQGHGSQGVVLTGGNYLTNLGNRKVIMQGCGIPPSILREWPDTANTYQEMMAISEMLAANPGMQAVVVSNALHMARLRFLRDKLGLNGKVFFQASSLGGPRDYYYWSGLIRFWFSEPLAYLVYRFRY